MWPLGVIALSTFGTSICAAVLAIVEPDATTTLINGGAALTNLGVLIFCLRWFMSRYDADRLQALQVSEKALLESREVRRALDANTRGLLLLVVGHKNDNVESRENAREEARRIREDLDTKQEN